MEHLPDTNKGRAKDIIKAFKTISGGQVPSVIIVVDSKKEPFDLIGTARILSESFNLNVVIDASYADTRDELLNTHYSLMRQSVVEIKPMTDAMMRELPQFNELFKYLHDTTNDKMVLAVCNATPGLLRDPNTMLEKCAASDRETVVRNFVESKLAKTSASINALVELYPEISEVLGRKITFSNFSLR
jgi:hypothetical protein